MNKVLKVFPFLSSNRFWAIVAMALAMLLNEKGFLSNEITGFILTIGGGHTVLRTVDRATEVLAKKKK